MKGLKPCTALAVVITFWASASADVLVNVGSPDTPFPRNKQNEPAGAGERRKRRDRFDRAETVFAM